MLRQCSGASYSLIQEERETGRRELSPSGYGMRFAHEDRLAVSSEERAGREAANAAAYHDRVVRGSRRGDRPRHRERECSDHRREHRRRHLSGQLPVNTWHVHLYFSLCDVHPCRRGHSGRAGLSDYCRLLSISQVYTGAHTGAREACVLTRVPVGE